MYDKKHELFDQVFQAILRSGEYGVIQSEICKEFSLDSRDGSRLVGNLERKLLVSRKKILYKGRWTYKIIAKNPIDKVDMLKLDSKYHDVTSTILSVLVEYTDGIAYDRLYRKVEKENPVLELVPRTGIIESALMQLEQSMQVRRIYGYWRYRPYKDTLILSDYVLKKAKEIKEESKLYSRTAFFGRKIGPNNFVDELLELRRGDLDDTDDQVTRIAGIFLSASPHLEVKQNKIPPFDFSVIIPPKYRDIKLIDPSENTVLKYHVLVKIESHIDRHLAKMFLQSLPESDKVILVTLKEVDIDIRETIFRDKVIVYGYEQITSLIEKIGKLPARVNSIAKIMYGTHRNKIVRINSLDYETRMAYVSALPNNEDLTTGLDSLNEIWLGNSNNSDNEVYSENYQQFLSIISKHAERQMFERGLINPKIDSIKCIVEYGEGLDYFERYLDPYDEKQLFHIGTSATTDNLNKLKLTWQVTVDSNTVKIFYDSNIDFDSKIYGNSNSMIKDIFHCSCMYWEGIIHSFPLCSHLITALDLMVKKTDCLNKTWMKKDLNIVTDLLSQFIKLNDGTVIEALVMYVQESNFPKLISFIDNLSCLDKRPNQSFILQKEKLRAEILKSENRQSKVLQLFLEIEKAVSRMTYSEVQQIIKFILNS